ncbi:2'-5' RNA ligase family protein [Humibacter ginsengiterrae]
MSTNKVLLAVVATPEPLPEPVDRSRWPVHVTIAGNFRVDAGSVDAIPSMLRSAAETIAEFQVKLGPPEQFGPGRDIPVLLGAHASLDLLHLFLATSLSGLPDFQPQDPQYWRRGYRPHASLGPAVDVHADETLPLRVLTLVSLDARLSRSLYVVRL